MAAGIAISILAHICSSGSRHSVRTLILSGSGIFRQVFFYSNLLYAAELIGNVFYHRYTSGCFLLKGGRMKRSINNTDEEKQYYIPMVEKLKGYNDNGIPIYLDGMNLSVEEVARACAITERGSYMADYVMDDDEKLVEVRFDKISG